MIRRVLVVLGMVCASLAFAATPAHAQYDTSCGFILNPPAIPVGGQVNIIGSGFGPNNTVEFFIAPQDNPGAQVLLGTTTSDNDPDGNVEATFDLPPGFDADGTFIITTVCPDGDIASNVLVVGAGAPVVTDTPRPTAAPVAQPLPVTGSDWPSLLARLALLALVAGGLVLLATRRQRNQQKADAGV